MKQFFDTSVLVAAYWRGHPNHDASVKLVGQANKGTSSCAAHTLAEVYATMTALPLKEVIPPAQALLFVQQTREHLTAVTLTDDEYFSTIEDVAGKGLSSGRVYDALSLRCAVKIRAEAIYTWNLKHFLSIRPDLAGRIRMPDAL